MRTLTHFNANTRRAAAVEDEAYTQGSSGAWVWPRGDEKCAHVCAESRETSL